MPGPWLRLRKRGAKGRVRRLRGKGPYLDDAYDWLKSKFDRYGLPYVHRALDLVGAPGDSSASVMGRSLARPLARYVSNRLPSVGYVPIGDPIDIRPIIYYSRSGAMSNYPPEGDDEERQTGWGEDYPDYRGVTKPRETAAQIAARQAAAWRRAAAESVQAASVNAQLQARDDRLRAIEHKEADEEDHKDGLTSTGRWLRKGGRFIGSLFGSGDLGEMAGAGVSKLFGQGAYRSKMRRGRKIRKLRSSGLRLRGGRRLKGSGAYGTGSIGSGSRTAPQVPQIHSGGDKLRIKHREYLGDLFSSVAFQNRLISINPGLLSSFPWLNGIAVNFEEYEFNGLTFTFHSTSSNALNSTNTALGTVVLAAEYNVTSPPFASKAAAENTMWCSSGKPSQDLNLPIECNSKVNPLGTQFVRSGPVPATDLRFNDLCNFQLITQGMQTDGANIGEIWVSYDVTFRKPVLNNANQVVGSAHGKYVGPASNSFMTVAIPPATGLWSVVSNTIGCVFSPSLPGGPVNSLGTVTFPISSLQQSYLFTLNVVNATAARVSNSMVTTVLTNCVGVPGSWANASVSSVQTPGGGVSSQNVTGSLLIVVPPSNVAATVSFPNQGLVSLGTDIMLFDMYISSVSNATVFNQ